jgi:hypothetical protein
MRKIKDNGMINQRILRLGITFVSVLLTSCVTINIYFPAAAAEKAADKIIDDVWQIQPDAKLKDATAP